MRRDQGKVEGGAADAITTALIAASLLDGFGPTKQLLRVLPVLAVLVVLLRPRRQRIALRIPVALTLFVGWSMASYAWSFDTASSGHRLVDLALLALAGFSSGASLTFEQLQVVVLRIVRAIIAASYLALLLRPGWSTKPPPEDPAPGWHALFGHKNGLGQFAVIALVTLWFSGSRGRRLWITAAFVLMIGSQSSTALGLVFLLGSAAMWRGAITVLRRPSARLGYLMTSWGFLGAGLVVMFTDFSLIPSLLGRGSTLSGRTGIWASVLHAIGRRPIQGYGFGGVWGSPVPPSSEIWKELKFHAFHAHSGYLDLALQAGVVGLFLFMVAMLAAIHRCSKRGGNAGRWAAVLLVLACLNAVVESSPFFGSGLLLVAIFATASLQTPAEVASTPASRRAASNSRYASGAVNRAASSPA